MLRDPEASAGFQFTADATAVGPADALRLEVPLGLSDKFSLLSWYADALSFPDYFGYNWDALSECLRDLSWLTAGTLVLHHRELPIAGRPVEQKKYLRVLDSVIADSADVHERHVVVVVAFDQACEPQVRALC